MTDPDSAARVLALFQPLIEATPQSFSVPAMTSADVEDIGVREVGAVTVRNDGGRNISFSAI